MITPLSKKPLLKKKKVKQYPVSYYSHKADKVFQELFRLSHPFCEICGNPTSCGHHYYPKSSAGNLRYNTLNMIAVCQSCHFRHHNGNPDIHNSVNQSRGNEWIVQLKELKKIPNPICNTKSYYVEKEKSLQEEISNFN